jgi:hypothetical protein
MRIEKPILALAVSLLSTGCASIVSGSNQPLSVETISSSGGAVSGATCRLTNNKGTWFVVSPGSVTVGRSGENLSVTCNKDGHEPGIVSAKSSVKGMAFGNILAGGFIGGAIDAGTGAAFDYPSLIQVLMGRTTTIGGESNQEAKKD